MPLTSRWDWILRRATRQLWVSAVGYALLALASVFLGTLLGPMIPASMDFVGPEAVDRVLGILASSMLAVTIFSLATMVSAHGLVTGSTSPRATPLVIDTEVTRHALGVFIGSFLFSLVGVVALQAGLYDSRGHVVLFLVTIGVIALMVLVLLRWIDHLARLAKVSETTDRVEAAALDALLQRARSPGLGCRASRDPAGEAPEDSVEVYPKRIGYVGHIDMAELVSLSREREVDIYVLADPGRFVDFTGPIALVAGREARDVAEGDALRNAFSIGTTRTFDFDPRFGLIVLGEIASRALSPGINDAGTAIDVIGRAVRILCLWERAMAEREQDDRDGLPRVWLPTIEADDLMDDIFTPIAHDAAANPVVQVRLQKALAVLAALGNPALDRAARRHSARALQQAEAALLTDFDRDRIRALALPPPGG